MADFSVNATQLSGPQGQGTEPIAPAVTQANTISLMPLVEGAVNLFANMSDNAAKRKQEELKNGIVKEYIDNENKYSGAFQSGQWDSARAASASRANYQKFIASNPGLINELRAARAEVYGGTETSQVARKEMEAQELNKQMVQDASKIGYQFPPGMDDKAREITLNAFQISRRVDANIEKLYKDNAELRAQRSDVRAEDDHVMKVEDRKLKEAAMNGLVEVASANFDSVLASGKDLAQKVSTGKMSVEDATMYHTANMARVDMALTAVAKTNPELAGPYKQVFDKMDITVKALMDPTKKSAAELQLLKDRLETLTTTQKLMALEKNPKLLQAYTASSLFPGDTMVIMQGIPAVSEWMLAAGGAAPGVKSDQQLIGKNDKELFNLSTKAIGDLQAGKIPADRLEGATKEANNLVNTLLKQTASVDGSLDPTALKNASKFYASTEFGKMALSGQIDKQTAANVQKVFQVSYEPAVRAAITTRLQEPSSADSKQPLMQTVNIDYSGSGVKFSNDVVAERGFQHRGSGSKQVQQYDQVDKLKDAENGLNQLIRMHAHLEGTTDYAKYWEANKHVLMPDVFPNPAMLKPGQVVDGHKYVGGNYRNPSNWIAEPASK